MADESGEVVRIVHRPGWFEQVKRELGAPMALGSELPENLDDPNTNAQQLDQRQLDLRLLPHRSPETYLRVLVSSYS
jgi:hypothetical protein